MSNTIYNGSYPSIAENYVYSSTGTSKVKTRVMQVAILRRQATQHLLRILRQLITQRQTEKLL